MKKKGKKLQNGAEKKQDSPILAEFILAVQAVMKQAADQHLGWDRAANGRIKRINQLAPTSRNKLLQSTQQISSSYPAVETEFRNNQELPQDQKEAFAEAAAQTFLILQKAANYHLEIFCGDRQSFAEAVDSVRQFCNFYAICLAIAKLWDEEAYADLNVYQKIHLGSDTVLSIYRDFDAGLAAAIAGSQLNFELLSGALDILMQITQHAISHEKSYETKALLMQNFVRLCFRLGNEVLGVKFVEETIDKLPKKIIGRGDATTNPSEVLYYLHLANKLVELFAERSAPEFPPEYPLNYIVFISMLVQLSRLIEKNLIQAASDWITAEIKAKTQQRDQLAKKLGVTLGVETLVIDPREGNQPVVAETMQLFVESRQKVQQVNEEFCEHFNGRLAAIQESSNDKDKKLLVALDVTKIIAMFDCVIEILQLAVLSHQKSIEVNPQLTAKRFQRTLCLIETDLATSYSHALSVLALFQRNLGGYLGASKRKLLFTYNSENLAEDEAEKVLKTSVEDIGRHETRMVDIRKDIFRRLPLPLYELNGIFWIFERVSHLWMKQEFRVAQQIMCVTLETLKEKDSALQFIGVAAFISMQVSATNLALLQIKPVWQADFRDSDYLDFDFQRESHQFIKQQYAMLNLLTAAIFSLRFAINLLDRSVVVLAAVIDPAQEKQQSVVVFQLLQEALSAFVTMCKTYKKRYDALELIGLSAEWNKQDNFLVNLSTIKDLFPGQTFQQEFDEKLVAQIQRIVKHATKNIELARSCVEFLNQLLSEELISAHEYRDWVLDIVLAFSELAEDADNRAEITATITQEEFYEDALTAIASSAVEDKEGEVRGHLCLAISYLFFAKGVTFPDREEQYKFRYDYAWTMLHWIQPEDSESVEEEACAKYSVAVGIFKKDAERLRLENQSEQEVQDLENGESSQIENKFLAL